MQLLLYFDQQSEWLHNLLISFDLGEWTSINLTLGAKLLTLGLVIVTLELLFNRLVRFVSKRIVNSTHFSWDDILYKNKVFDSLGHFFPVALGFILVEGLFKSHPDFIGHVQKVFYALFVLIFLQFSIRMINSVMQIATSENNHQTIAVRSFSQLLKILSVIICVLMIISIIFGVSFSSIITSLGTATAVIVLIFRDTILGFISGVQMATTRMIKVGDWITIPKHTIEGIVIEINLISAKIENFDKTITTVPTYDLISTAVTNFEVMRQKNIRRIKRSILFNTLSFKFLEIEDLKRFKNSCLIGKYIEEKEKEISIYNEEEKYEINYRKLSNIGLFREYALHYLKAHPMISNSQTLIVRHLEPTQYGLPLQLYCFTKTSLLVDYERIQADVFDHLFAVAYIFDLELTQVSIH
ncbi:mechanosensitive ion channel family protein [Bacteroidetes bacterium endosymbiont of Geopemphigus sp.]|uniref:mechanosensitive ion channel family protein n=1 Tax=Bacteroidetes bacterium endosymbiont of Geopemphigus sp. TaxID=2047937 RepID=UPI000CD1270D|nr:mechanosensitive ion channel domain-containing protein [Bacteroidetes bacterium endosymbiont of Geopemphigus sp.]